MPSPKAQQQVYEPSHNVLQQLNQLKRPSPNFPNQLTNLLSREEYEHPTLLHKFCDEDRAWLIEYLDNVRVHFSGCAFVFYHHHLVVFPRSDPLALWVGQLWYGPKQQVQGDLVTLEKSSPNQSTWVGVQPRLHHLFPLSSTPIPMRSRQP